jgi:hypothetical protein
MVQNRRRRVWLAVGISVAVLAVACVALWLAAPGLFARMYMQQTRQPIRLTSETVGAFPSEHHLDDVPWIATREWYCQSNSLAMIAARHGIDEPTGHFCFLTGFTYGASRQPDRWPFLPYADPETGFGVAAPYLGLVRRYYVTDDASLYLDALRHYLSRGYPVRVALNGCLLPEMEPCADAHSEVLVGYYEGGFFYYETVFESQHLPPGEEGIWVSERTLLDAVANWSGAFSTPWRYALTVFEVGPVEEDPAPLWARNGELLAGGSRFGPRQGADAIEALASQVEGQWAELDLTNTDFGSLRCGIEAAAYTRHSNAAYLRAAFSGESDIERAAGLFDEAADHYADALAALEDGVAGRSEAEGISKALRDVAALEREIGQIFLSKGRE